MDLKNLKFENHWKSSKLTISNAHVCSALVVGFVQSN